MDTNMTTLTPSATTSVNKEANGDQQQQQFFDTTGMYHQQIMQQQQQQHQQHHYQQYFQQAQQAAAQNQVTTHLPLGFNPLTPPGLPQAILPALPHFYTQPNQQQPNEPSPQLLDATYKSVLTPRHTPPMDITPPKSPKASNTTPNGHQQQQHQDQQQQNPELTSNSSKDLKYIADSDGEESIRLPIYNSHGKMKNYRCKSCGSVAITKLAFWEHAKTHMKPEKILRCEKCPFVTELKHHLEYHIRKHKNLKPFQCDKCSYSCVNKSMLNSHLKSHSSVYQYRCVDCPYVTKYVHSFKLHLRKQDHKPGMVLDEAGIPNPTVVIDVYGTRRGPKNKGVSNGCGTRKSNNDFKMSAHHHHQSQLSAALQGIPLNSQNHSQQKQMPTSPAKTSSSVIAELPALTLNISLQQQKQQQQQQHQEQQQQQKQQEQQQESQNLSQSDNIANLLPSLASLLQQNSNMAFFPFPNINLQVLAAQQQAAVLAQLSPRMREQLQKYRQENNQEPSQNTQESEDLENDGDSEADDDDDDDNDDKCSEEEEEDQEQMDSKSVDSAMDLSQGTPTKEDAQQQQTPQIAINFKLPEDNIDTPLFPSTASNRRKGRVLKLDNEQQKNVSSTQSNLTQTSSQTKKVITTVTVSANNNDKMDDTSSSSADERMEVSTATNTNTNNSRTSTASSSVKSSNSSSTTSNGSTANSSPSATPTMYECKYCDISFKNAVLYTIHMGYHSCDDVFKCNMCGEKCDGPVGLFVHIAHYAHS